MATITCPHCGEKFPNLSEFMRAAAADALYKQADEFGIEPGADAAIETDTLHCNVCDTFFKGEYGAMDTGQADFVYSFTVTSMQKT